MARRSEEKRIAVVTGDVTIDWNLAHARSGDDTGAAWSAEDATEGYVQPGGAALLGELIETAAGLPGGPQGFDVRRVPLPVEALSPRAPGLYHSYAFWSRYRRTRDSGPDTWRVKEFLGLDRPRAEPQEEDLRAVDQDPAEADLVVLDDAGLDFREDEGRWPAAIEGEAAGAEAELKPWVVLKMAEPVADGGLWEHLLANFAERLIVVVTVNDLRLSEAQISRAISWERTALDLARELVSNPRVNSLSHCAHVVVSLNTEGALLLSRRAMPQASEGEERRPKCELFFDPQLIEGMWAEAHPGRMVGYTTCLTAAIALQLMLAADGDEPDMHTGIRRGLDAMRTLHLQGYGAPDQKPEGDADADDTRADLKFPDSDVAEKLIGKPGGEETEGEAPEAEDAGDEAEEAEAFAHAEVPAPSVADWTILKSRYPAGLEFGELAAQVAKRGAKAALADVPLGEFGKLVTVDRREIEGYQSIRALIQEYRRWDESRPLSIAVFGPPGAGKSFGVVQVAKSLGDDFEKLEFNLSQFNDPAELHGAFHQVRDETLRGRIPLVFWDEFDTNLAGAQFGWLRHFLAPMQDGKFLEGEILHPIGRAIFVFAGGTSKRMEEFRQKAMKRPEAKGRDFVSRLKGHVDVVGPNPRNDDPDADPYHQIRRAILLRSMLEGSRKSLFKPGPDKEDKLLSIDPGVLRAVLRTREYKHGARSLESIVAMSALHGQTRFERSSLPARDQLDMHVDADDFLALATRHEPEEPLIEKLAEASHVRFCRRQLQEGYRWNEDDTEYLSDAHPELLGEFAKTAYEGTKEKPTLVSWRNLPEAGKEQNRSQVRKIPSELEAEGYVMRKARGSGRSAAFDPEREIIERLAEREHERWLLHKLDDGWRWAEVRNEREKHHPDMLPWRELDHRERWKRYGRKGDRVGVDALPDDRQEEDRAIARAMGEIIAAEGYEIVRIREPGVVVGVTGHRILAEVDRLESGVRDALARIEQAFPDEPLAVLSALAEGADRLVAKGILSRRNGRLRAVLPLPASDYETDFRADGSKRKFWELLGKAADVVELPVAETREAAYEAGGRHVLDNCDVLVAIWDGEGAQGQGGTGGTVAEARERGLPIAWVHAGNRKPGTEEPTSLGEEQGTVTFENWAR